MMSSEKVTTADALNLSEMSTHRRAVVIAAQDRTLKNGTSKIRLSLAVPNSPGTPIALSYSFLSSGPRFNNFVSALVPEADTARFDLTLPILVGRDCVLVLERTAEGDANVVALIRTDRAMQRGLLKRNVK